MPKERILVIKLGALGDFIYSIGPMQAIKKNHPDSELTLMTRPAFEQLGQRINIFDEILIDQEPKKWQLLKMINLRNILRAKDFTRIYDLQTSDRTGFYYKMLGPGLRPEWSGIVKGCSHYHHYKRPTLIHTQVRQREQLRIAGIEAVPESTQEAAEALGMSRLQNFVYVILPLAFRVSLPALNNNLVNLVKTTTQALAIAVPELLYQMVSIYNDYSTAQNASMVVLFFTYIILVGILVMGMNSWERAAKIPGYGT